MSKTFSPGELNAIRRLAEAGLSPRSVSLKIGRNVHTVRKFMLQNGLWGAQQNNQQRSDLEGVGDPTLDELHLRCHAFRMFSQGDSVGQVATALQISREQAAQLARECPTWWGNEVTHV